MTGCTVLVVLFVTAMNLILEAGSKQCRGPRSEDGTQHPVCRAFIDDITVMTQSGPSTRWVLEALSLMVYWARMVFKPRKSRSLFIYKGEVKTWGFKVQGEDIPTIQSESIRCLGKNFDESLKDTNNVKELVETVKKWLAAIDRSELQGRFKTWCFQYGIIPRLQWPFQMYNIPITIVQQLSRICSKHLRKWLGVPPGFSSVNLYSRSSKLVLPFKEVEEEFKATKVRGLVTLQSSKDEKARETWLEMSQGTGWSAEEATTKAREALKHQEVLGIVCEGRRGLGNYQAEFWSKSSSKQRRDKIVNEIRKEEENKRRAKAVQQASQGRWTTWETAIERKLTWNDIWEKDQGKLSFLLRAVSDLLPSPVNLKTWGLEEEAKCPRCTSPVCNLEHILSSCSKSLSEGRYRWRHDKVLEEIAKWVDEAKKQEISEKRGNAKLKFIAFHKEGEIPSKISKTSQIPSIFSKASDWIMQVDIKKKLRIPDEVLTTKLRPDLILTSSQAKHLVIAELTVPWEERMQSAHEKKMNKYQEIVEESKLRGWSTSLFAVEVGCRGFPSTSLQKFLRSIGLQTRTQKRALKVIGAVAESSSRWLWIKRAESWSTSASGE